MAVSKVVLGNETLVDLTSDTVSEDTLLEGATAHAANGEQITGGVVVTPMYTGTKAAIEEAIALGQIPEDAVVNITDDEETSSFQTQINEINSSLQNENNESFNFGYLNGVRGFFTNPSRADDCFVPFSNIKGTLLWTNANPNANFSTTTIDVPNLSNYDSIKIVYKGVTNATGNASKLAVIIPNNLIYPYTQCILCYATSIASGSTIYARPLAIKENNQLFFANAVAYNTIAEARNQYCIPLEIYGLNTNIIE